MALNFGLLDINLPAQIGAMPGNALAARRQRILQDEQIAGQREQQQMQNALARMQMTKAQREMDTDDAMRNALSGGGEWGDVVNRVRAVDPMRALEVESKIGTVQSAKAAQQATVTKQAWDKLHKYREYGLQNVTTPQQYASWLHQQHTDPELAPVMSMLPPLEESLRTIPSDPQQFERFRQQGMLGMQKWLEMNKPSDFERTMMTAGLSPEEQRAAARARITKEVTHAPSSNITNYGQPVSAIDPQTGRPVLVQFNKSGTPKVAPFEPYNAQAAEITRKQETGSRKALDLLSEAEQWIDKATGSRAGAVRDAAGRLIGVSTEASEASARLSALQGALMMAQPRMEGPQSNLDVALYERMAGRIGDPTIPAGEKKAAVDTIRSLHQKYAADVPQTRNAPAARGKSEGFDQMPNPAQYTGQTITDTETGIRYRSNGKQWMRQ